MGGATSKHLPGVVGLNTTEALSLYNVGDESGTVALTVKERGYESYAVTILAKKSTETAWQIVENGATLTVNPQERIYFKCIDNGLDVLSSAVVVTFSGSGGRFSVEGNKELLFVSARNYSLRFEDWAALYRADKLLLPATTVGSHEYDSMFKGCINLTIAPELSATTLGVYAYDSMFMGCVNLTTAPELPSTSVSNGTYYRMFMGCVNLTTPPELPSTSVGSSAYHEMFRDCTNLTIAPELPATTLGNGAYRGMFYNCTSLTIAPELPATTLRESVYHSMFWGCTNLTTAPSSLPAISLKYLCYSLMFCNCTNLIKAPIISATELGSYCCEYMFCNCSKITQGPELRAANLVTGCYKNMFYGCSSLNYLKVYFKAWGDSSSTEYWMYGVSSNGTFEYPNDADLKDSNSPLPSPSPDLKRGISYVPEGWTTKMWYPVIPQ